MEVDASHAVTVSRPGDVAELIDAAARATADEDGAAGDLRDIGIRSARTVG